ncbi:hypothetical protein V5F72_01315 [Xanthobacter flavus]|uniref:hypothetical protein n=1 Tax=Xanthobacter flavus TaxID=281 RepID=UPI003728DC8B
MAIPWKDVLGFLREAGLVGFWAVFALIGIIVAIRLPEILRILLQHRLEAKRVNAELDQKAERFALEVEDKRRKIQRAEERRGRT